MLSALKKALGRRLARYLAAHVAPAASTSDASLDDFAAALRPGDVLLVDGRSRFSTAIKYLTQSSWPMRRCTSALRARASTSPRFWKPTWSAA